MAPGDNLWIVIPAFNEGGMIGAVVDGLHDLYPNIVVVDDCSDDHTAMAAAAAGAVVLRHPINLGQGAALQTGIRYALAKGATSIVTFDADGQHRCADIAALLEMQSQTNADVVLGSRFLGSAENIPRLRRLVLKCAVLFTRLTTGMALTDAHNGLRLLTRRAAERIKITQDRMAHASEMTHQMKALGLTVAEAPVTVVYTEYSLRKGQTLGNAANILAELIASRFNK